MIKTLEKGTETSSSLQDRVDREIARKILNHCPRELDPILDYIGRAVSRSGRRKTLGRFELPNEIGLFWTSSASEDALLELFGGESLQKRSLVYKALGYAAIVPHDIAGQRAIKDSSFFFKNPELEYVRTVLSNYAMNQYRRFLADPRNKEPILAKRMGIVKYNGSGYKDRFGRIHNTNCTRPYNTAFTLPPSALLLSELVERAKDLIEPKDRD